MDGVQVEGADTLARTLGRVGDELADLTQTNIKVATDVGRAASQRAPRRSGRLSATWHPSGEPAQSVLTFGVVHAAPINFGVGPRVGLRGPHNIAPTRFATGAAVDTTPAWVGTYTDHVQDLLAQVRGA